MTVDSPAIRVSHVSKRYRLGGPGEPYHTVRDALVNAVRAPKKIFSLPRPEDQFYALRDVSFDVRPGEVIGIIGRNGAGKSTLLKILSRITFPTEGMVTLRGRVGSLLEVGTGFHPELTGRENIFLSGSILGMKRKEIDDKLDEIVKFSEIERFLDTPVKRYSSGMYVRLAFAVAAHLEPEILLIDEVLAVGDAAFQKKCLGKVSEVAGEGRTVLFVSHNMAAITRICRRALLLEDGNVSCDGPADAVVETYMSSITGSRTRADLREVKDRRGDGSLRFLDIWIEGQDGQHVRTARPGQQIAICALYELQADPGHVSDLNISFAIRSMWGTGVTNLNNRINHFKFGPEIPRRGVVRCTIPGLPLNAGRYHIGIYAEVNGQIADWIRDVLLLHVEPGVYFEGGMEMDESYPFFIDHSWQLKSDRP